MVRRHRGPPLSLHADANAVSHELRVQRARVEREQEAQELVSHDEEIFGEDEVFPEDDEISAARTRSFKLIRQLLLAPQLGTS